jgi:excisionase family DNA binding protein
MTKIFAAAALSLVIILAVSFGVGVLGELNQFHHVVLASVTLPAPAELHQFDHIVLATATIPALEPRLYRVEEVCKILAIGTTTLYALIAKGELDAVKIGNKTRGARGTRITAESVQRLLQAAPKAEITGKYLTLKTRRKLAREQGVSRA